MSSNLFSALGNNFARRLGRIWSGNPSCGLSSQTNKTEELIQLLKSRFPNAERVEVEDVSGGCGAMFEVYVKDTAFQGINTVKQHRLITETLGQEIKNMHGIRIHTEAVKK